MSYYTSCWHWGCALGMVTYCFAQTLVFLTMRSAIQEVRAKMNIGEGEKFTAIAMAMTLRAQRKFPWKPASRCSRAHPGLCFIDSFQSERHQGKKKGRCGRHFPAPSLPSQVTLKATFL